MAIGVSRGLADFEYSVEHRVYFYMYDTELGLIGAIRPGKDGLPNPQEQPVGVGETYRKALLDLQDNELK